MIYFACTTAKSETKKCLFGEEMYWPPARFVLYSIPCVCGDCAPPCGKKYLQQFCGDAPRNRRSPMSELPYCIL